MRKRSSSFMHLDKTAYICKAILHSHMYPDFNVGVLKMLAMLSKIIEKVWTATYEISEKLETQFSMFNIISLNFLFFTS